MNHIKKKPAASKKEGEKAERDWRSKKILRQFRPFFEKEEKVMLASKGHNALSKWHWQKLRQVLRPSPECEWWPMTLMTLMTYDDIAAYWESNCLSTDNPHWVRMAKKHGTACTNFPAVAESRNSTDHTETFTIWPLWHSLTRWKAIAEKLYWWSLPAWSWKIFKSDLVFCAVNALQYTKDYVSCGLSH